jgi:hypothetical protein
MKTEHDIIYDLKGDEFAKFVMELLRAEGYRISDNFVLPREVDFVATKEEKPFAVIIKHRKALTSQEVGEFFGNTELLQINMPRDLLFVTSARITEKQVQRFRLTNIAYNLEILALDDLQKLISRHVDVADKFLKPARTHRLLEKAKLATSLIGAVVALAASILTNGLYSSLFSKPTHPLDDRIQSVESALANIKGLEETLRKVRDDMVATQNATSEINKKYTEAKELEKLTDVQIQALKQTLQTEKWWKTLLNYALGFVLGIASSLIASVLYARWKQNRELQSGS